MAIFRNKKDDCWWIDYYYQGRRKREKIGPSYKLAKDVLAKRKLEIAERKFFPDRIQSSITLNEMCEKFWNLRARFYRSRSWANMRIGICAALGQKKLSEITVSDLQEFYNQKRELTSVATANRYMGLIKSVLNRAVEWDDLKGENPASRIKNQREANHRLRFLSKVEIERLLNKCDRRIYPILSCAILTGMRKSELLNLSWENLSLDVGIIYILESKSGKLREIPISSTLHKILTELGPMHSGKVFDVPEITLRRLFAKALQDALILDFTFHGLRHTFASHYIMSTSDLPALQKLLGHSTPMMTLRYAHYAKSHMVSGMQLLDSAVGIGRARPVVNAPMDTQVDTQAGRLLA